MVLNVPLICKRLQAVQNGLAFIWIDAIGVHSPCVRSGRYER